MLIKNYLQSEFHYSDFYQVKIDTGSERLWVFDKHCKDDEHPLCADHNKYDSSLSEDKELVDDEFSVGYGKGGVEGMTMKDTVYLTDNIEIEKQIFGAVTKTKSERKDYDGLIGKQI